MDIKLAPEQENIVKRLVDSGKYGDAGAAVAEALRVFDEEYDHELMMPKAAVAAELRKGVAQLDRGEGIAVQSEGELDAFFDDIEARGRERIADHKKARTG